MDRVPACQSGLLMARARFTHSHHWMSSQHPLPDPSISCPTFYSTDMAHDNAPSILYQVLIWVAPFSILWIWPATTQINNLKYLGSEGRSSSLSSEEEYTSGQDQSDSDHADTIKGPVLRPGGEIGTYPYAREEQQQYRQQSISFSRQLSVLPHDDNQSGTVQQCYTSNTGAYNQHPSEPLRDITEVTRGTNMAVPPTLTTSDVLNGATQALPQLIVPTTGVSRWHKAIFTAEPVFH